jgi:hypothetical protein
MKKLVIIIFSLLSFLVFTNEVKAVDEYRVYINGTNSNNIVVRKTTGDTSNDFQELSNYSDEWKIYCDLCFMPKCEFYGWCPEEKGCGKFPPKNN